MADSGRYTLTRAERLRGIKRIDDLWNGTGHSMTAFPIRMVYMLSKAEADEAPLSMMVTVPKRLFHHAVDRNRIKRQIREFYRNSSAPLKEAVASRHKSLALAFLFNDTVLWDSGKFDERLKSVFDRLVAQVLETPSDQDSTALAK